MNLLEHQIVLDSWEAEADYDLDLLWQEGVRGLVYRLNDTKGTLHMDADFVKNWERTENWNAKRAEDQRFGLGLYNVYSPWETSLANWQFLSEHRPVSCKWVEEDMELKNPNKTADQHADEYTSFISMHPNEWSTTTYTGAWFKEVLAHWPLMNYTWARYPKVLYPAERIPYTWVRLRANITAMEWLPAVPLSLVPGPAVMWQCSGDRLIMPGTGAAVDINVFKGTYAQLMSAFTFPKKDLTLEEKVNRMWLAFIAK